MNLTANFTLEELTASDYAIRHGINNHPVDHTVLSNLHVLADGLERVRAALRMPIFVSSGYRSAKVNSGVGGAKSSAHMLGLAADIHMPGVSPRDVCKALIQHPEIGFDQLISEGTWTHISFPEPEHEPAGMVLTAIFKAGQPTTYVKGIA